MGTGRDLQVPRESPSMLVGARAGASERVDDALERALHRLTGDVPEVADLEETAESGAMAGGLSLQVMEEAGHRHDAHPGRPLLLGALALVMEHARLAGEQQLPARPDNPPAVVHVLAEQEVALVEATQLGEDVAADEQAGPDE